MIVILTLIVLTTLPFPHVSGPADTSSFDYVASIRAPTGCTIGAVKFTSVRLSEDRQLDSNLLIERDGRVSSYEIPHSRFLSLAVANAPVVCDETAGRAFIASPIVGTVSAFSVYGDQLWEVTLPGFRSSHSDEEISDTDQQAIIDGLAEEHSIVLTMFRVGEHVVVEYRTGSTDYTQVVLHRSGAIAGVIGPWDGIIVESSDEKLVLVSEFEIPAAVRTRPQRPTRRITATIHSKEAQEIKHFVAWILPLPGDKRYVWRRCASIPRIAIEDRLGSEFDKELARKTKSRHDELGPRWWASLANKGQMAKIIGEANPTDESWVKELEEELLRVGGDVHYWLNP